MNKFETFFEAARVAPKTLADFQAQGYVTPTSNRQKFKRGDKVRVLPYGYESKAARARVGQVGEVLLIRNRSTITSLWAVKFDDGLIVPVPGAALMSLDVEAFNNNYNYAGFVDNIIQNNVIFLSIEDLKALVPGADKWVKLFQYQNLTEQFKQACIANKKNSLIAQKNHMLDVIRRAQSAKSPIAQAKTEVHNSMHQYSFYFGYMDIAQAIKNPLFKNYTLEMDGRLILNNDFSDSNIIPVCARIHLDTSYARVYNNRKDKRGYLLDVLKEKAEQIDLPGLGFKHLVQFDSYYSEFNDLKLYPAVTSVTEFLRPNNIPVSLIDTFFDEDGTLYNYMMKKI
jgi:hypothetical protein